jgi:phage-related protein
MTSPSSLDVREVVFINERCRLDYETLPPDVRESADQAVDAVQNGRNLPKKMLQPLKGKLSGVTEIRFPYDDDTYRVYLTLQCPWIIMVLDAGIKKSTAGKNIPRWQQERLEERFKSARDYCRRNETDLRKDYEGRKLKRDTFQKEIGHGRKS